MEATKTKRSAIHRKMQIRWVTPGTGLNPAVDPRQRRLKKSVRFNSIGSLRADRPGDRHRLKSAYRVGQI